MQEARGTPLTPQAGGTDDRGERRARYRWTTAAVFVTCYVIDIVSKVISVERLQGREPVEILGHYFQLQLVRNPGAAFSTGTSFTLLLSCLAIVGCLAVLWFARQVRNPVWAVAMGVLLAGIGGNLTDRIFRSPGVLRGHVIDMFSIPNWPIFNVADICINVGAGLILVQVFRGIGLDGTREEKS